jgi:hypothetical protein
VPEILVPDNLRSGVTRAHRYEPELNATYQEMAAHYRCVVIPARPAKPRDKAKVEAGVLLAERWILASLRKHTFFSIAEANLAIAERLRWLNERPFQKLDGSRRSLFEEVERVALWPLPARPYEYATWKALTVNIDYHVEVGRHYYSVPYQLARQRCELRLTATTGGGAAARPPVGQPLPQPGARRPHHAGRAHARVAPAPSRGTPGRIVRWAQTSGPQAGSCAPAPTFPRRRASDRAGAALQPECATSRRPHRWSRNAVVNRWSRNAVVTPRPWAGKPPRRSVSLSRREEQTRREAGSQSHGT